jgi:tripartite-type tricarboxylate transporter receptor subunit TctC
VAYVNALSFLTGTGIMDNINWVIYGGGGESVASLAGKHIDCAISTIASASSLIRANRIRPLMVIGEERDISLPDISIPKDLGYDFKIFPVIRGAFGPPKMPIGTVNILEKAFANAIKEKDFLDWAQRMQKNIVSMGSEAYKKSTVSQYDWLAKRMDLLR